MSVRILETTWSGKWEAVRLNKLEDVNYPLLFIDRKPILRPDMQKFGRQLAVDRIFAEVEHPPFTWRAIN